MSKEHNPRYIYDCKRCKYNWNCGYLCSCILKRYDYKDPPESVKKKVNKALIENAFEVEFK